MNPPADWSTRGGPGRSSLCRMNADRVAVLGDVAGFGFYDKFTFGVWVKPDEGRGGTILSRMVDEPQGEGYSVVLEKGKVQVNLVKRWLDDAIRVETKDSLPAGVWTHVAVTYDGSRYAKGVKVYLDGKPAAMVVQLDELNQTFFTKEPLRLGCGGGPGSRFCGALRELFIYSAALSEDELSILATKESIAEILSMPAKERTAGAARKIRGVLSGERRAGIDADARREAEGGESRAGRLYRADPDDDGDGRDGGAAGDARARARPVRPAGCEGLAGRAAMSNGQQGNAGARPAGAGALAGFSGASACGAGGGESRLADVFRHGAREDARRFRCPGGAASRIPSCSTGWRLSS